MKWVWFVSIVLLIMFSLMFVWGEQSGLMDPDAVAAWFREFEQAHGKAPMALAIIGLLTVDLLLPVPSSIVMVLSGVLLGAVAGGLTSFVGAILAAEVGYWACRLGGERAFRKLTGASDHSRVGAWFERYGVYAIIFSRPIPMLTEILSCMAGLSGFRHRTFLFASILGTLPICFVYSVAGQMGDSHAPWIAIWTALAIPTLGWLVVRHLKRKETD